MVDVIKEKIQHPGWATLVLILLTLGIGFGEWGTVSEIEAYGDILQPQKMFSLLKYICPVGIAVITRGFIK